MTEAHRDVEIGIRNLRTPAGSHIAYLWERPEQFREAVQFLHRGARDGDHLVVFGHDEANDRVLMELAALGLDPAALESEGRLSVLGPGESGEHTLERIGETFQAALDAGAPMIRLLGNIGWGRHGWPDERELLRFEAQVTKAAANFPCVVVCLYDIGSLTGSVIFKGAFCTHPLTIYSNLIRTNPMCIEVEDFLARMDDAETDSTDTAA